MRSSLLTLALLALPVAACSRLPDKDDSGTPPETDTDTDADSDADTDTDPPMDDTVNDVRNRTIANGTLVTLRGVQVTDILDNRFIVQEPSAGPESAIEVFTGLGDTPEMLFTFLDINDIVDVVANAGEFNGNAQIDYDGSPAGMRSVTEITDQAAPLTPDTLPLSTFASDPTAEPYQFGLVQTGAVTVTALDGLDLVVEDSNGDSIILDDFGYTGDWESDLAGPCVGATLTSITGNIGEFSGAWRIYPRFAADLVGWDTAACP